MRRSSVATMTREIVVAAAARRYTCSIIGRPAMSASALPGRRLDSYRAGMMATAKTEAREREGPVLKTGGTNNLNTLIAAASEHSERAQANGARRRSAERVSLSG